MPIPATPDLLKTVIGGDVLPIADDVGADSGALSYAKGWPPLTAMPLEAGGIAPRREYFNAVNALVSQHLYFLQSGGVYPWRDDLNYLKGWQILVDGEQYTALLPSGPDVLAEVGVVGPKPPAANPDFWQRAGAGMEDVLRRAVNTPNLAAGYYITPLALEIVGGVVTPTYIDRNVMTLAVTESITLAEPETIPAGGGARIIATIDATGNRALTLAAGYRIIDGEFDGDAGAVNILDLVFGGPDGVIDVQISQRGEA